MKKLNNIVCDNPACRKVISDSSSLYIVAQGKKRRLYYCSIECQNKHHKK